MSETRKGGVAESVKDMLASELDTQGVDHPSRKDGSAGDPLRRTIAFQAGAEKDGDTPCGKLFPHSEEHPVAAPVVGLSSHPDCDGASPPPRSPVPPTAAGGASKSLRPARTHISFGDPRLPPRFWAKLRIGSVPAHRPDLGPCWEWRGYRGPDGYGRVGIGSTNKGTKRTLRVHRWAYESLIGPIPGGLESDHLCRNRPCANPLHLEPVSRDVNWLRGKSVSARNARKTHCDKGHPFDVTRAGRRDCRTCIRNRYWNNPEAHRERVRLYRGRQQLRASATHASR